MVDVVPNFLKKIWGKWNIRGVILASLGLQIFLIVFAPMRKRSPRSLLAVWFLWSAYLLADSAATFCIGLICNRRESMSTATVNDYQMAFWGPFLLLHLGGPDTITAFALEDNELWLRHLFSLLVQVGATVYVFLLTIPGNTLWIPTVLVFVAGTIKFSERTRALYLASMSTFRQSMVPKPDPGPNYAKLMEEYSSRNDAGIPSQIIIMGEPTEAVKGNKAENQNQDQNDKLNDLQVVESGYLYFHKFRGLIVDMIYSHGERNDSRDYFLSKTATDALSVIEVELNFIYDAFFTKASVLRDDLGIGYLLRFVSFSSLVAAFVLFILHDKRGFNRFDVIVTYALLYGAFALDTMALFMLIFSDQTLATGDPPKESPSPSISHKAAFFIRTIKYNVHKKIRPYLLKMHVFLKCKKPRWSGSKCKDLKTHASSLCTSRFFRRWSGSKCKDLKRHASFLCTNRFFRRWSGSVSGHNLMTYCLRRNEKEYSGTPLLRLVEACLDAVVDFFGAKELVEKWIYKIKKPLHEELWKFIFEELKRKSKDALDEEITKTICSARGEWVIDESGPLARSLMPFVESNTVAFDESLLLWHVATDLCYYGQQEENNSDESSGNREQEENNSDETSKREQEEDESSKREQEEDESSKREQEEDESSKRELSKVLSDYMLYLLVMEPSVMSAVAGIGQIRFQDTWAEAIKFFSKRDLNLGEGQSGSESSDSLDHKKKVAACEILLKVPIQQKPIDVKGDRSKSVLFDACKLAHELNKIQEQQGKKWKIIAQVWVEFLSFAASNCRPPTLVQQLSKGGELISLVWLLMVQLGLSRQFQIKEGHARAKLIVGKNVGEPDNEGY